MVATYNFGSVYIILFAFDIPNLLNPGIGKPYTTVIFRRFGPYPFGYCRMSGRIRFGYSF